MLKKSKASEPIQLTDSLIIYIHKILLILIRVPGVLIRAAIFLFVR